MLEGWQSGRQCGGLENRFGLFGADEGSNPSPSVEVSRNPAETAVSAYPELTLDYRLNPLKTRFGSRVSAGAIGASLAQPSTRTPVNGAENGAQAKARGARAARDDEKAATRRADALSCSLLIGFQSSSTSANRVLRDLVDRELEMLRPEPEPRVVCELQIMGDHIHLGVVEQ